MSDETKPATEMVPAGEPMVGQSAAKQMQSWGFGPGKSSYITSIDESKIEGRIAVFKLLQSSGNRLDDYFNTEISVTDYLVSPIEIVGDNGEMKRLPLVRMLLADGKTMLQTTGKGVAEILLLYTTKIRPAPWNPPAMFKPRKMGTNGGGQFYTLEPLFAEFAKIGEVKKPKS